MSNTICKSQEEYTKKIVEKQKYKEFIQNMKKFVITSRFNNETWNENMMYRNKNKNIGCVYCSPEMITKKIPTDSILFVLEMNNEENKIMGIGMIRNHPICGKYRIYSNGNYNRYVYMGKNRIDRKDMTTEQENIMKALDILCFTGNKHMKRGQGLKMFPLEILFRCSTVIDLVNFISDMFKNNINENKKEIIKIYQKI